MNKFTLVIGNKKYSSWSLRPWFCLQMANIPFKEKQILLHKPETFAALRKLSPSARVPILIHDKITIWDSLSICEYLAELYPGKKLWPSLKADRAHARSICAEMHSGFASLRQHMNMNCVGYFHGKGMAPGVQEDIDRILEIWADCRLRFAKKGPFLFGHFTIADAFFAPVCTRFRTYGVKVPDKLSAQYMEFILESSPMTEWVAAAKKEKEVIADYEKYR